MLRIPKVQEGTLQSIKQLVTRGSLPTYMEILQKYGDIVELVAPPNTILCGHPNAARHVFHDNAKNYFSKDKIAQSVVGPAMGMGLLTTNDYETWKKSHQIAQTFFRPQKLREYFHIMVKTAEESNNFFHDAMKQNELVDFSKFFSELTIKNLMRTLFENNNINFNYGEFAHDFITVFSLGAQKVFSITGIPWMLPTKKKRALDKAVKAVHETVDRMIQDRLKEPDFGEDYLGAFLKAYVYEADPVKGMKQVHDEIATILCAGHETTASTLQWIFATLSRHPDVEKKLREEIDSVMHGRAVVHEDIKHLPYTQAVISETLRLYPNVPFASSRIALGEDTLMGYRIPAKTLVTIGIYYIHRHPDFWDNPEGFDPERFIHNPWHQYSQYAFIPGSAGPRVCLGINFAVMEMIATLVTFVQNFRFTLPPGKICLPSTQGLLWIEGGLKMYIKKIKI